MNREELQKAYDHGVERCRNSIKRGTAQRYGCTMAGAEREEADGLAAAAEYLVAATLGLPWTSTGLVPDNGVDVGTDIGVRHAREEWKRLILHPGDRDDMRWVLVVGGSLDTLRIVGWCYGHEAKTPGNWKANAPNPAYFCLPGRKIEEMEEMTAHA